MSSIQEKQQVLIDDFDFIEEWMDKYNHIIEMGKSMTTLSEEEKEEDLLVKGCQSKVWLKAEKKGDNVVFKRTQTRSLPKVS